MTEHMLWGNPLCNVSCDYIYVCVSMCLCLDVSVPTCLYWKSIKLMCVCTVTLAGPALGWRRRSVVELTRYFPRIPNSLDLCNSKPSLSKPF